MKKIISLFILSVCFCSNAHAKWWDCTASVEKKDIYGWLYGYDFEMIIEISADRRSEAESKAISEDKYVTKSGFFGKKNIFVCAAGKKKHDGETCKYRFYKAECRRQ